MPNWDDDRDYTPRHPRRRVWDPDYSDYDERLRMGWDDRPPPHSGLGIISLVISVVAGLGLLVVFVIAGIMAASDPGGAIDEKSPEAMIVGLVIFAGVGLALIGAILGLIGVILPGRNKLFAIIGLVINGLVVFGTIALVCLGVLMEA